MSFFRAASDQLYLCTGRRALIKRVLTTCHLALIDQRAAAVGVHQDAFPRQVDPHQAVLAIFEFWQSRTRVVALQGVAAALPVDLDLIRAALNVDALPLFAAVGSAGEFEIQLLRWIRIALVGCARRLPGGRTGGDDRASADQNKAGGAVKNHRSDFLKNGEQYR